MKATPLEELYPKAEDVFLTREEAARLFRVRPRTMLDWERAGFGPPVVKVSPRLTLYSRQAALAFLRSRQTGVAA